MQTKHRRALWTTLFTAILAIISVGVAVAHPLGNFTINHFSRIGVGAERIEIHHVIDMAEIPAFQERRAIDSDGDGTPSDKELDDYTGRSATEHANGILLSIDGIRVPLQLVSRKVSLPSGGGGLPTLRIEYDFVGMNPINGANAEHRLRFEDNNYSDRIGWREIVISPAPGVAVFNSSAFGNGVTDEIKAYPDDMLARPLDERIAELSFTRGSTPPGAITLLSRDGSPAATRSRDLLAELIAIDQLTPGTALLGLLLAVMLGGLHALSPGHGKAVVGAYLVGSRGTLRHAAFLGLTVTITHTLGVFALGLVTLLASQYVVPEKVFPVLSLISGVSVVVVGMTLLVRRSRAALAFHSHAHTHESHSHIHKHEEHIHHHTHGGHDHIDGAPHSHGGRAHSHLPPGADGSRITLRSLIALGVSGGLLPCPSALVVLLAAISLNRVGYGLLLVVAFSMGLAGVLTCVGLLFIYAGRLLKTSQGFGRVARWLPLLSAVVITFAGAAISYEALGQAGIDPLAFISSLGVGDPSLASVGALGVLGLGLIYGLKHATEVDHVVAVSTIISEHRKLARAALVGGMWGAGHTISLVVVGSLVLAFRVAIPDSIASWMEFGVALMIIGLGVAAFRKALRVRSDFHKHEHSHGDQSHAHIHFHESDARHGDPVTTHSHVTYRIGLKPAVVGAMHGLAGSAALTLLVLTQIDSALLGVLYLAVFGVGSVVGMVLMSGLVGLPFAFGRHKTAGLQHKLQILAGALSISFGLWYAYETGFASGLMTWVR